MRMEFVVLLEPGTEDGEVKQPHIPPEEFTVEVQNQTKESLMQAVQRIADQGERSMMQIQLRYIDGGPTIIESPIDPIVFTGTSCVYPLGSESFEPDKL